MYNPENSLLSEMARTAPMGICILDAHSLTSEMVNDKFVEISGKPYDEIFGKFYWDAFPETKSFYEDTLNRVVTTGIPYQADEAEVTLTRNGVRERVFITFTFMPVNDGAGKISKVAVWAIENTLQVESRQATDFLNEQLTASNKQLFETNDRLNIANENLAEARDLAEIEHEQKHAELKGLFENAPVAMATFIGPQFVIGLYNEMVLEFWGRTAEQVAGLPLFEALPEAAGQGFEELLTGVYTTGIPFKASALPVTLLRNGVLEDTFIDFIYEPIRDSSEKIYGIIVVCVEVTEQVNARKKMEQLNADLNLSNEKLHSGNDVLVALTQDLRESEARFRSLAEGSEVMISINDVDGNVEYVNKAWLNLTGKTQQQMQDYGWGDFLHPEDQDRLLTEFRTGIESKLPFTVEFRMMDSNGKPRWIYTRVNPRLLKDGSYGGTISSSIDVTDQVVIRNEISDVNERLNIALDAGNFGTTEVDLASGTMVYNERFLNLFGRTKNESMTYQDMFEAMLPEYRDEVRRRSVKAREERSLYEATYQVKWPDGSLHWIEAHGRGRYDKDGNPDRMVGILADVTEQMANEQRKNDFIGMVSHELKTPITSLNAYLQMLQGRAKKADDDFTANALDKSVVQVKKMTTMINGFLNVSRLESGKIHISLQEFDMALLIREIQDEFRLSVVSHQVEFSPCEEMLVIADRDKIGNVLNNLISNAVKYSPNGSTIRVVCKKTEHNIQVSIQDEGVGVSASDSLKLFDRYYRTETATNSSTSGFGIGLYLSAEIIQHHNGKIWVESELGKGSTFYFTLPAKA